MKPGIITSELWTVVGTILGIFGLHPSATTTVVVGALAGLFAAGRTALKAVAAAKGQPVVTRTVGVVPSSNVGDP